MPGPHHGPVRWRSSRWERPCRGSACPDTAGLRLGFIVLPHALASAFAMARALTDRHAPGDAQDVLARFISEGHLLRHLRRTRELYPQAGCLVMPAMTLPRCALRPVRWGRCCPPLAPWPRLDNGQYGNSDRGHSQGRPLRR
jgi:hypothetical protein